jgi:hypothetical protein
MRISFSNPVAYSKRPLALAITLAVTALVLTSAPALAAPRASHAFSKAIGHAGEAAGDLSEPADVAVNESKGLVYVADIGNDRVDEFETSGTFVRAWGGGVADGLSAFETCTSTCRKGISGTKPGEFERPESIAVDNDPGSPSFGDVYVADQGHGVIDKFSSTGAYLSQITETGPWSEAPENGTQSGHGPGGPLGGPIVLEGQSTQDVPVIGLGVAVGSNGELWVDQRIENGTGFIDNFSGAHQNVFISTRRGGSAVGGFAVGNGEVFYVDGGVKYDAAGAISLAGFDTEPSTGLAVESSTGSLYVDNVGSVARFSSEGVFGERFGVSQLSSGTGLAVTDTGDVYVADGAAGVIDVYENKPGAPGVEGEAFANVSAHNATLSARVNTYGLPTTYTIEYGTSEAYGSIAKTGTIPGSYNGAVTVSATLEGLLQPETTYHFRVTAKNEDGVDPGGDVTFKTLGDFPGLPDGRGYEMVSPIMNADGNVYLAGAGSVSEAGRSPKPMRASADGNAVQYVAGPLATGGTGHLANAAGNEFVATRNAGGGWSTVDVETPGFDRSPFEVLFSNAFVNSGTDNVPVGTHDVSEGPEGIVDRIGGRSVVVSVLPAAHAGEAGVVVSGASFGGDASHEVSADGSRVFWTDDEQGADQGHVFVRKNDSVTAPVSVGAAQFWTASTDGRYAFYTENEQLWRFDVENGSREDLASEGEGHAGESAGVLGVIGVNETGEDGAYIYFAATGVLAGNENATKVKASSGGYNLYIRISDETVFIAPLSSVDLYGQAFEPGGDLKGLAYDTAEPTADGHGLAFVSEVSLTGYDNVGCKGGSGGGFLIPCREVYVYDADTGGLSCASCNPTGIPATSAAELTISRSVEFAHRWISENSSRVFFETSEGLVAQDTNGAPDVYEWEQDGSGSCGSVRGCVYLLSGGTAPEGAQFLDASASGDDVFMITRAELVAADQGETREVYDARVGAVEPPAEPACTGTGCQGLPSAPPPFATPSSVTFNGVGNFSPSSTPAAPTAKPKPKSKPAKCRRGFQRHDGKCARIKTKKSKAKRSIHGKGSK